jgi:hypothetical protein
LEAADERIDRQRKELSIATCSLQTRLERGQRGTDSRIIGCARCTAIGVTGFPRGVDRTDAFTNAIGRGLGTGLRTSTSTGATGTARVAAASDPSRGERDRKNEGD